MPRTNYLPTFMTQRIAGQDSNDIFDIQARQSQSQTDVTDYNKQKEHKDQRKISEFEDVKRSDGVNILSSCRRSLSEGKIQQNPSTKRSPPVAVGKENIGTHFKGCMSPRITMNQSVARSVKNSDEESSGDEASSGKISMKKPTTKRVGDSVSQSRLGDSTNVTGSVTQNQDVLNQMKPRRPCIRVREPPGGKSSIVFN